MYVYLTETASSSAQYVSDKQMYEKKLSISNGLLFSVGRFLALALETPAVAAHTDTRPSCIRALITHSGM